MLSVCIMVAMKLWCLLNEDIDFFLSVNQIGFVKKVSNSRFQKYEWALVRTRAGMDCVLVDIDTPTCCDLMCFIRNHCGTLIGKNLPVFFTMSVEVLLVLFGNADKLQTKNNKAKTNNAKAPSSWQVKGVNHETRNAAKAAARKSGKTMGAWVNDPLHKAATAELTGEPRSPHIVWKNDWKPLAIKLKTSTDRSGSVFSNGIVIVMLKEKLCYEFLKKYYYPS